jgi:hypothetical protein
MIQRAFQVLRPRRRERSTRQNRRRHGQRHERWGKADIVQGNILPERSGRWSKIEIEPGAANL